MDEVKVLTADEVYQIILEVKMEKEEQRKAHTFAIRRELFKKHGRDQIRSGLVTLVKERRVKMGNTINDYYFEITEE